MDDISSDINIQLNKVCTVSLQAQFYPVGRDSLDGIAIRYRLNGPWIESWWGRDFSHPSRQAMVPTQVPIQWVPGLS